MSRFKDLFMTWQEKHATAEQLALSQEDQLDHCTAHYTHEDNWQETIRVMEIEQAWLDAGRPQYLQ